MKEALKDYADAFEAHINAQKDEMVAKIEVKKTYYALIRARDMLRDVEKQLLEDVERN